MVSLTKDPVAIEIARIDADVARGDRAFIASMVSARTVSLTYRCVCGECGARKATPYRTLGHMINRH